MNKVMIKILQGTAVTQTC